MTLLHKALLASLSLSLAQQAFATVITGTLLPASQEHSFRSAAVDPVTGKAYMSNGYNSGSVSAFANVAALETQTVTSNFTTNNYGTYLAAHNGSLYMHVGSPNSLQISKLSAATGALEAATTVGGLGVSNGAGNFPLGVDSFNWGGYSVLNPMSDGKSLYVVGGMAGSRKWGIATFDFALNQEKVVSFNLLDDTAGFAFAVNGYVYFGDWYNKHHISRRVEAATGDVDIVDITLDMVPQGFGSYMTGVTYDSMHDTLYTSYLFNGRIGKATNIASQLGLERAEVPEPTSLALFGLGLAVLGGVTRRHKKLD